MIHTPPEIIDELHGSAERLANGELPDPWEIVSSSPYARVAYHSELAVFYKEFLPRSPLESIKAWFRGSRATRARTNSDALNLAGFDAPANITWGTLENGSDYLFTRAASGYGVDKWLKEILDERSDVNIRQRRLLLTELGIFIGRLHTTGFTHGDLRTSNVLAEFKAGRFSFTLIDNERNHFAVPAPGRMMLRNLMQLNMMPSANLSKSERMRFFRAWRSQMRELSSTESKTIAIEAYAWARRRLDAKSIQ